MLKEARLFFFFFFFFFFIFFFSCFLSKFSVMGQGAYMKRFKGIVSSKMSLLWTSKTKGLLLGLGVFGIT